MKKFNIQARFSIWMDFILQVLLLNFLFSPTIGISIIFKTSTANDLYLEKSSIFWHDFLLGWIGFSLSRHSLEISVWPKTGISMIFKTKKFDSLSSDKIFRQNFQPKSSDFQASEHNVFRQPFFRISTHTKLNLHKHTFSEYHRIFFSKFDLSSFSFAMLKVFQPRHDFQFLIFKKLCSLCVPDDFSTFMSYDGILFFSQVVSDYVQS